MQYSVNKNIIKLGPNIVSFDEIVEHLQLPELHSSDSDELAINTLHMGNRIQAAQSYLNDYLGEFVSDTVVSANYKDLNSDFILDFNYIKSITDIEYYNENNVKIAIDNPYILDNTIRPSIIKVDRSTPINVTLSDTLAYPVCVTYTAGLPQNTDDAYDNVKLAIMMIIGEMYNNRTNTITRNVREGKYTFTALKLVNSYRRRSL